MSPTVASPTRTVPASGVVHWLGAGLSTGSQLGWLADRAERLVLWHRDRGRAERSLAERGLTGRADVCAFTPSDLAARLGPGDVVVSMLSTAWHPEVTATAIRAGAHMACSSYTSPELAALSGDAAAAGTVILTEAGLDPGIDHLLGIDLVTRARLAATERGASRVHDVRLTSFCGGLPAEPNEFRYRFSWAPSGVLGALRTPAHYLEDGALRTAERPWEALRTEYVGDERFEAYPNRDSLSFVEQYGIPAHWTLSTFLRGTLRLDGWASAWEDVLATVADGDPDRIATLAEELGRRHPTRPGDRDRVVLAVTLEATFNDGPRWRGQYLLDELGDGADSAMARCVTITLTTGVDRILVGDLPPGLTPAPGAAPAAASWLEALAKRGVRPELCVSF